MDITVLKKKFNIISFYEYNIYDLIILIFLIRINLINIIVTCYNF